MGYIDRRTSDLIDQPLDLNTHRLAGFAVQMGKRFVHQQKLRLTDDGSCDIYTLFLSAGKLDRHLVQQIVDLHERGDLPYPSVDLVFINALCAKVKRYVSVHIQRRIHGVVFESKTDVPVLRMKVVHKTVPDVDIALCNLLQAGDHPERRGFSAAGGAEESDELTLLADKIQVLYGIIINGFLLLSGIVITFIKMFQSKSCHHCTSFTAKLLIASSS